MKLENDTKFIGSNYSDKHHEGADLRMRTAGDSHESSRRAHRASTNADVRNHARTDKARDQGTPDPWPTTPLNNVRRVRSAADERGSTEANTETHTQTPNQHSNLKHTQLGATADKEKRLLPYVLRWGGESRRIKRGSVRSLQVGMRSEERRNG